MMMLPSHVDFAVPYICTKRNEIIYCFFPLTLVAGSAIYDPFSDARYSLLIQLIKKNIQI